MYDVLKAYNFLQKCSKWKQAKSSAGALLQQAYKPLFYL